MLSGKLPTGTLAETDEPSTPAGPRSTPTPPSRDRRTSTRPNAGRVTPNADERVERLAAENERLREQVERERKRRKSVVERYERMIERRDATSVPNGRKRADGHRERGEGSGREDGEGARTVVGALRALVADGVERVTRLRRRG